MIFNNQRYAVALTVLLALPLNTLAQAECESPYRYEYEQCMEASLGVTVDMLSCISEELAYQDQQLNIAYKELMPTLTSGRQQALKQAQRLWIKYRDSNCDFYADPDGGSLNQVQHSDCVLTMTAQRTQELRNRIMY
jgi:uncharacterized protein YecT (DUF1311 family)